MEYIYIVVSHVKFILDWREIFFVLFILSIFILPLVQFKITSQTIIEIHLTEIYSCFRVNTLNKPAYLGFHYYITTVSNKTPYHQARCK